MTDSIINWDNIIHKNVRAKNGEDAGNVDAIEGEKIVIASQGDHKEYSLPKDQVDRYNGAEVFLKVTRDELEKYKI
jgi:hypothetical protein